ncbi:MAG: hypothetical protein HY300_13690 [Verrucomicrobia bacterium]|nr:hypothetical protein [Verrucomicrobiota bacterium]
MHKNLNVDDVLDEILARDTRYARDAYHFMREALDHTQRQQAKARKAEPRHVTGQELLEGIRIFALDQFGPMTLTVLDEWGVRRCEDFGEIVFNMVDSHLLGKTDKDSREDFKGGYDFHEAFRKPFLPSDAKTSAPPPEAPVL